MKLSPDEGMERIKVGRYDVEVRRSAVFRRMSLRMSPGKGIWVNVPAGFRDSDVVRFVSEYGDWIEKNIELYRSAAVMYEIGGVYSTRMHKFAVAVSDTGGYAVNRRGDTVTLYVPASVSPETLDAAARRVVARIYKSECMKILPARVKELAERFGFSFGKLSFRNNVSNWGSCSAENNISLNVNLMKLPDDVVDYVILHELCHTVVRDHSERFWELVGRVCPDYKVLRKKLKEVR